MKKWLTRCAVVAALILTVLLVVVLQPNGPGIGTGKPLPPGKVRPQLVIAQFTAVLLAPDGSLWAWGGGLNYTLKYVFPQPAISQTPCRIGSESDWTQVAAGVEHVVALKNDGSLWSWGRNDHGQVGQGNLTNYIATPTRIGTETNWTQICANFDHSLALKSDGSLWAWGENEDGELGDGTTNDRAIPTLIGAARDWRTIAASCARDFALKKNGTLWVWGHHGGSNDLTPRQIAPDTNWLAFSDCGGALVALKTDGTLWLEGTYAYKVAPAFVSGPTEHFVQFGQDRDWTEVYVGAYHFYGRKKDGSWWGCGGNDSGELGPGTKVRAVASPQRLPFNFDPWAFATESLTTLLLSKDGKLWTWGCRLGVDEPGVLRRNFEALVAPAVKRIPSLGSLIKSDIDYSPHLLWELPPEVQRSLRTAPAAARE
jgi:alpha-tubulin suppressor-like RCC1 family protein